MSVEASGRLLSPRQGGWGVWCRQASGDRYEFLLSHTGQAVITGPGGAALATMATGLDPNTYHVIRGECTETAGGVKLAMRIDGHAAARATATGLGRWATVGIHAFSYGDVPGRPLGRAYFRSFVLSAL
jgi:hypothetical protein